MCAQVGLVDSSARNALRLPVIILRLTVLWTFSRKIDILKNLVNSVEKKNQLKIGLDMDNKKRLINKIHF